MHVKRRILRVVWLACALAVGVAAQPLGAQVDDGDPEDGVPGPRCYRKTKVEAVYETSQRLVRKARLVHEETDKGQITMTHYPAIYIEEKTLVSPSYILLQEVRCTKRVLRRAEPLPMENCLPARGCIELDPPPQP
ncbi:hypothetical protein [Sagittula salina]|uniref:Uncharacterized protein n=1 Tax=Sagittula salina TaxID=2820268 RepID=A0A940MP90_9RHOB|nr:hypothetical protein [Sagittula salina]MBP0482949.1 hypothetical protein [Sagittula salina]